MVEQIKSALVLASPGYCSFDWLARAECPGQLSKSRAFRRQISGAYWQAGQQASGEAGGHMIWGVSSVHS